MNEVPSEAIVAVDGTLSQRSSAVLRRAGYHMTAADLSRLADEPLSEEICAVSTEADSGEVEQDTRTVAVVDAPLDAFVDEERAAFIHTADQSLRISRALESLADPMTSLVANLEGLQEDLQLGDLPREEILGVLDDCISALGRLMQNYGEAKVLAAPPSLPTGGRASLGAALEHALRSHPRLEAVTQVDHLVGEIVVLGDAGAISRGLRNLLDIFDHRLVRGLSSRMSVHVVRGGDTVSIGFLDDGAPLDGNTAEVLAGFSQANDSDGIALLAARSWLHGQGGQIRAGHAGYVTVEVRLPLAT